LRESKNVRREPMVLVVKGLNLGSHFSSLYGGLQ
jgi:hypothetical protein